jgi:hypothetical protein
MAKHLFKKGHKINNGRKRSKDFIERMRKTLTGRKRPKFSKEWIEKMSISHKGKHYSIATEFKKGQIAPMKGRKRPDIAERNRLLSGDKNPNWRGGTTFEPYSIDWTKTLKISIRERDKYTCRICGEKQGDLIFGIHHIDYDKKNCNPNNLITLCRKCHCKTNFNRDYWILHLKDVQIE